MSRHPNSTSFKPRTAEQFASHFWSKLSKTPGGCWLFNGKCELNGYARVKHCGRKFLAHRLAYTLAKGEIPNGLLVCHSCDQRSCCNPEHLFVGSPLDNVADAVSKRRHAAGERCNHNKVTAEEVKLIRQTWSAAEGAGPLARRFGISREQVYNIVQRRSWKHVP